jgi:hypothetical protein
MNPTYAFAPRLNLTFLAQGIAEDSYEIDFIISIPRSLLIIDPHN